MQQTKYITLGAMAEAVGLPRAYLRELAKSKQIPSLKVKGRRRFNPIAVDKALATLATEDGRGRKTILGGGACGG